MSVLKRNLIAIALGFTVAVLGTVVHQSTTGPEMPIGLIMALAMVLFAATEVRTMGSQKLPSLLFTITLAISVFLAAQDLTGDKLIPLGETGLIWSYGSIAIAIIVSAFPRFEQSN